MTEISPYKLAIGGVTAVVCLNFVLRVLLNIEYLAIWIPWMVPSLVLTYLVKFVRRRPTPLEIIQFQILYSSMLAAIFVVLALWVLQNQWLNSGAIVVLIVNYIFYPIFSYLVFSEGQLNYVFKD